jgi:uncharacterized membrane protein
LIGLNRAVYWLSQHWFATTVSLLLVWVGLPWLAPVMMKLGWEGPANFIYSLYSFQCHQLPQRSFFLFGSKSMYSIEEIQAVWPGGTEPLALRQFIGSPAFGYKVAWSDRMVSAYSSIPLAALVWWPFRRRIRPLGLLGAALLALPMFVDGSTHMLSDLGGLGQGFRYTNDWLATITAQRLPAWFYAGNQLGSFNSWMRLVTGSLFGIGLVWFALPQIGQSSAGQARQLEAKFERAGLSL